MESAALALEIAWLDQLTKGRTLVGFARGYQARWLNQMAQHIHVGPTSSDQRDTDRVNREAFEEVFRMGLPPKTLANVLAGGAKRYYNLQ